MVLNYETNTSLSLSHFFKNSGPHVATFSSISINSLLKEKHILSYNNLLFPVELDDGWHDLKLEDLD